MRIPHFQFYLSLCSAMAMMSVEIEIGGEQISARREARGQRQTFYQGLLVGDQE